MIDHTSDCEILNGGVCTCKKVPLTVEPHPHPNADFLHRFGRQPKDVDELNRWEGVKAQRGKAGTSRTVDTEPRVTWLGDTKFEHPRHCAVYRHQGNWAPYCDCGIRLLQYRPVSVPMTDPGDVPKEYRPWRTESRAPWWVWMLFGAGATSAIGLIARWPW